jgi:hypothetical protein
VNRLSKEAAVSLPHRAALMARQSLSVEVDNAKSITFSSIPYCGSEVVRPRGAACVDYERSEAELISVAASLNGPQSTDWALRDC